MLIGSIVNVAASLAGSTVGLLLRWGVRRFSALFSAGSGQLGERLQSIIMQGLALCTTCMGISGSLKGQNSLIMILSMVIGGLIGELLDLDRAMKRAGNWVQEKMSRFGSEGETSTIAEGFVTASLLYCVGAMSIVGALNSGLMGDHDMLFAKSLLDGTASIIFTVSLGVGVPLSAIAVFCYQVPITLAASVLSPFLGESVIAEMTCVGSLLILAISLNMLGITKIKVMNLIPAIFLPIFLCRFF